MIKVSFALLFIGLHIFFGYSSNALSAEKFFDNKKQYQGFYWFEDKQKDKKRDIKLEDITPEMAANNMEIRKKQLNEFRNIMFELIFQKAGNEEIYKAVKNYKQLEKEMMDNAVKLAVAWESVNFTHPDILDRINNPVNVQANKLKRSHVAEQNIIKIQEFARMFDLVLFEQKECIYCQEFKPILTYFIKIYGFNLEIIESGTEYDQIVEKLSIKSAPTLIAISKEGKAAFELIRGLSTLSELENNILIATELLESGHKFTKEDI